MLLSCNQQTFSIPRTSTCVIHSLGEFRDGDAVSITSPVFASTSFTSRAINMSEQFLAKLRITNGATVSVASETEATLICEDNDIFHMYVTLSNS
jgi:hypothetical protein